MAYEVRMPQLGLTMTEGTVTRWMKREGDTVTKGEPLFEVETDKLTNQVESEAQGVLHKIIAPEGAEVPTLGLVAIIGDADEEISAEPPVSEKPERKLSAPVMKPVMPLSSPAAKERVRVSPLAKKVAVEKGLALSAVAGTGPKGRILRRDVDAALAAAEPQSPQTTPSGTRRVQMNPMRRAISRNIKRSFETAPVVHYNRSADVTALVNLKSTLSQNGQKISYTDILVRLVAGVLMRYPAVNASVDGDTILYHDTVNMGVAVALEDGLVVPVIKDAQSKGIGAISAELRDKTGRARENALDAGDMSGGTFTITNLGMFGIESFTPIINQPESAILGINSIVETAVVVDGETVMRPRMNLSLTADHRVIDGAVAARFLRDICTLIENPWQMLL